MERQGRLNEGPLFDGSVLEKAADTINQEEFEDAWEQLEQEFHSVDVRSAVTNGEDPESKVSGVEENVKNNLVVELFQALGWDKKKGEITWEDSAGRGSVDSTLKVDGSPKVYVEIKTWRKDLVKKRRVDKYQSAVDQALKYAQRKGVPWVFITNGYEYRLYKTYIEGEKTEQFSQTYTLDSLRDREKFRELYTLLSRKRIQKLSDLFDKTRLRMRKIDEHVLNTLLECRSRLVADIYEKNGDDIEDSETLKEYAQRILDRILFIRYAEDNGLFHSEVLLRSQYEQWKENLVGDDRLVDALNEVFRYVDRGSERADFDGYNGDLFKRHPSEDLDVSDDVLEFVIERVYKDDKGDRLDFSELNADIVGSVYEKYLGWALEVKGEEVSEETDPDERKELGQYYTPPYVVEFIIDKTIGQYFDGEELDLDTLTDLKVLDPACGSGAFLIKAYDKLREYYEAQYEEEVRKGAKGEGDRWERFSSASRLKKFNELILHENLHGVDLNPEAAEITKMNLWFRSMQRGTKLNELDHNIKVGNTVIEDSDVAGDTAFVWEEEFPNILERGGFDVIMGNPPYIKYHNLPEDERDYFKTADSYDTPQYKFDIYVVFIERCINLLKEGGRLSFIVPATYMNSNYGELLREKILEECQIEHIVDLSDVKVFEDASVPNPSIFVIRKEEADENDTIQVHTDIPSPYDFVSGDYTQYAIPQSFFERVPRSAFRYKKRISSETIDIIDKIEGQSNLLEEICYTIPGVETGIQPIFVAESALTQDFVPAYIGDDVSRYQTQDPSHYLWYTDAVYLVGETAVDWVENSFDCTICDGNVSISKNLRGNAVILEVSCQECSWSFETEMYDHFPYNSDKYEREEVRDSHYVLRGKKQVAELNLKRPRTKTFFESSKLLTQKVAGERGLLSSVGEDTTYALDSLIVSVRLNHLVDDEELNVSDEDASLAKEYSEEELLGIINSKLMKFYFRLLLSEDLNVYPRDLNQLPISNNHDKEIRENVAEILDKQEELRSLDTEIDPYLNRKPQIESATLEEYIENTNVKVVETISDSSEEGRIERIWVERYREEGKTYDNDIIIKSQQEDSEEGGTRVLRLETSSPVMTEFLMGFINSIDEPLGKGVLLRTVYDIELPKYAEDWEENQKKLLSLVSPYKTAKDREKELREQVEVLENVVDALVFDLYEITSENVELILNSTDTRTGRKQDIMKQFRQLQ